MKYINAIFIVIIAFYIYGINHSVDHPPIPMWLGIMKMGVYGSFIVYIVIHLFSKQKTKLSRHFLLWIIFLGVSLYRVYYFGNIQEITAFLSLLGGAYLLTTEKTSLQFNRRIALLIGISIVIQFFNFQYSETRGGISFIDPNISAYFIFLAYILFEKVGFHKLKYILLVMAILTVSRSFMLSFVVLILLKFDWIKQLPLKIGLNSVSRVVWFFLIVAVGLTFFLLRNTQHWKKVVTEKERITSLMDKSNKDRFTANKRFFEVLFTKKHVLFGEPNTQKYTHDVFRNIPHNSYFDTLRQKGLLLGFLIIILFLSIVKKTPYRENMPYIIAIVVYQMFLVIPVYSVYVIFLLYVLNVNKIDKNRRLENKEN